ADEHGKRVGQPREATHDGAHAVVQRIAAAAQRERLLEHEQERDAGADGRDERKDRARVHAFGPAGDVRPDAGPHRKWPSRIPTTTAITKADPGYACT